MTDDVELLRRFAADRSETAMAELVRRHIGLVYHTALRLCGGDHHRAQDVAQSVFVDLARKAGSLANRPSIAGWLHTSAHHAAVQVIRSEARRSKREQQAQLMISSSDQEMSREEWHEVQPVLDSALKALRGQDREAVLLRFFEGRTFAELGAQLAISEDAARMRVERGLERLRTTLARRGVTSTTTALSATLAVQVHAAVPAEVIATTVSAAMAAAPAGAALVATSVFTMTKLQIGLAAAVVAVGGAGVAWQWRSHQRLETQTAALHRLEAENDRLRQDNQRLNDADIRRAPPPAVSVGKPPEAKSTDAAPGASPHDENRPTLAAGLVAIESLGNAGTATARAALATQLWAARTGDVELESSVIALTPEGRAKLEALLPKLPANLAAQYDTPEKLMAFALAGSPHPVGGMAVLGETDQGPDDVVLQMQWQHADDDIVHQSDVHFHHASDGWKMIVPTVLVNRAAAYLSNKL